ncbi:MAG: hypothetical protein ACKVQA_12715 [Burkholderiales bacterium]
MTAMALRQFTGATSGGASEAAKYVGNQIKQWRWQLQGSYSLGQYVKRSLNELYQVFEECRQANWDGYEAAPVSERAFQCAYEFLEALPLGAPAPSVGAEPDGHITLEWHQSPRRTLSISVSPESDLHYAALIGASKAYGTEPFFGEVPKEIMELIHRVTSA